MYRTPPLTFDPAAVRAWLRQPSDEFEDTSRAESLGVDDELTAPGVEGFLNTVDLANGVRLATLHQDIKDFADRDQHGIPAVLSALAHVANQAAPARTDR